jgi:protease-4
MMMTATADMILERRRIRRRLAFWRIAAIVAFALAVLALLPRGEGPAQQDHVARITVDGVIFDDSDRLAAIRKIAETDAAKALIVQIASPGGTVVGSEALYVALRKVAETKPVVAIVGEIAASGGYITAIAADYIVTRQNSITGSIGVISQIPNVTGLMEKLGVSVTEIKSAPLKGGPSPVSQTDPAALRAIEVLILDSFEWFKDIVGDRRGLEGEALTTVADGRVFTGRQAMALGLIDAIGAEDEARDWLAEMREVSRDLKVRDYRWGQPELPFPFSQLQDAAAFWTPGPVRVTPGPRLMALFTG